MFIYIFTTHVNVMDMVGGSKLEAGLLEKWKNKQTIFRNSQVFRWAEGFFQKQKNTKMVYNCLSICSTIWRLIKFSSGIE